MVLMFQEKERLQAMMTHLHLNKKKVKLWIYDSFLNILCWTGGRKKVIWSERERILQQNSRARVQQGSATEPSKTYWIWTSSSQHGIPTQPWRTWSIPWSQTSWLWISSSRWRQSWSTRTHQTKNHRQDSDVSTFRYVVTDLLVFLAFPSSIHGGEGGAAMVIFEMSNFTFLLY